MSAFSDILRLILGIAAIGVVMMWHKKMEVRDFLVLIIILLACILMK